MKEVLCQTRDVKIVVEVEGSGDQWYQLDYPHADLSAAFVAIERAIKRNPRAAGHLRIARVETETVMTSSRSVLMEAI